MRFVKISILFAVCLPACAADDPRLTPPNILTQSIQATGGAAAIDKFKGEFMNLEGKLVRDGKEIDFTGEFALQLPDQFRHIVRFAVDGKTFESVAVFNRDKGWRKRDGVTEEMSALELTQARDLLHSFKVARMTPVVKDQAFQLTNISGSSDPLLVEGVPAWCIKVTSKDEKDVVLCINVESKRLQKLERILQVDAKSSVRLEEIFSDYREVQGVQRSHKRITLIDGKKISESRSTNVQLFDKIDEGIFHKP
jgi:hypothetical protein